MLMLVVDMVGSSSVGFALLQGTIRNPFSSSHAYACGVYGGIQFRWIRSSTGHNQAINHEAAKDPEADPRIPCESEKPVSDKEVREFMVHVIAILEEINENGKAPTGFAGHVRMLYGSGKLPKNKNTRAFVLFMIIVALCYAFWQGLKLVMSEVPSASKKRLNVHELL